jgi:hypothetical protein
MSHRVYLYNVGLHPHAADDDQMMVEAAYQLPALLLPLLAPPGTVGHNRYNTGHRGQTGLYFDAAAGIARLRQFFAAIDRQPGLVQDRPAFEDARARLFTYLDELALPRLHLDLWDVFNMSDTSHAKQARSALADFARYNALIDAAIDAGDLSVLDGPEASDLRGGRPDFASVVNDPNLMYGLACFDALADTTTDTPTPFEKGGRWGLRAANGKVLAPAQYDAVYEPGPLDLAVVMQDGKFGYLNARGVLAIPLCWDDAFDFDYGGLGIVARDGKFGLIDATGALVQPAQYDELDLIGDDGDYSACLRGRWGVLDRTGTAVIACEHERAFDVFLPGFFVFADADEDQDDAPDDDAQVDVTGGPQDTTEQLVSVLYHRRAGLLASGFDELLPESDACNALGVRMGKQYGVIGVEQAAWLLPPEYDQLASLPAVVGVFGANFVRVTQGAHKGLFDADMGAPGWLLPLDDWQDIVWVHERCFAVQRADRWYFADTAAATASGDTDPSIQAEAGFDLIVQKPPFGGFAYALRGKEVWIANEDGLYPAPADQVLADLEYSCGIRFSREARRRLKAYAQSGGG